MPSKQTGGKPQTPNRPSPKKPSEKLIKEGVGPKMPKKDDGVGPKMPKK